MEESSRNLERMGLLVLAAAAMGFVAVVVLPRLPWTDHSTYSFLVPIDRGIQTLAPGSDVLAGGLVAGTVVSIDPIRSSPALTEDDALRVEFTVPESLAIYEGARVRLVSALIGSSTDVALVDAFSAGRPRLASGAELPWLKPPETLEVIFGTLHWQQIKGIAARFERMFDAFPDERRNFSEQTQAIREQVVGIGETVESDFARWGPEKDRIVERFTEARAAADRAVASFEAIRSSWQELVQAFSQVEAKVKSFFPAGGGNMEDLKLLGTIPDASRIADSFQNVTDVAQAIAPAWNGLVDVVRGPWSWAFDDVRLSIANMTLAVGQFGLIAKDLERDPLAALAELLGVVAGTIPDQATLDVIATDEAMRRFARATADVRAARAAIEAWIRQPPPEGAGDPVPAELRAWFERSQQEFADAANALFRMRMKTP
ncbi:MAG: MlaD family protein [Phycisphaerales bacterium]